MPRKGERQNLASKQATGEETKWLGRVWFLPLLPSLGTRSESGEADESINLGLPQEGFPPAVWGRRALAKRGEAEEEGRRGELESC
jgi:hypothetical protein